MFKSIKSKLMTCAVLAMMVVMILGVAGFATGNTWTTKENMLQSNQSFAISSSNGKIYIFGGSISQTFNRCEEFDPITNIWTSKTNMPTARSEAGAAAVNGKIYVIGGTSNPGFKNVVEEYTPSTDTWATKATMPTARSGFGIAVDNNIIYIIGGVTTGNVYTNVVESYNPLTNTWSTKTSMPTARAWFTASSANSRIYSIGGFNGTNLSSVEEYNTSTDSWATKTSMNEAIHGLGSTTVNNKIFAIGGTSSGDAYMNLTQEYNPSTDSWTVKTNMPTGRRYLGVTSCNDKLYAMGGQGTSGYLYTVEEYTPPVSIPDAPTNLSATVNNNQVSLSWTASTGATSYNVKRSTTSGSSYTATATNVTNTSYTDTTVSSGNTYYYVVTAVNEAGESSYSNEAVANLIVGAPTLTGTWSSGKVNLSWTSVNGATSYKVKKGTTSGSYTIIVSNLTNLTYEDTNVQNGETYYYVVSAVGSAGEGSNSNEVALTLLGNKAILQITMTNGTIKEFDMTIAQIDAFITWYDNRAAGTGKAYYKIRKTNNIKPFLGRIEYIVFDKISDFEVKDYND